VSVAVAIDGEIVHEAAFGARIPATLEAVSTTDTFRVASISKTITAITMLQLIEEGLVGLDDPVGSLVAADLGIASPSEAVSAITIRQLLTHTSGLAQYEDIFFRSQVGSCEEAAGYALNRSLSGPSFRYSNMNYCVLGLLIEQLTGESYEQVVYERLLTPLGIAGMRLAPTYDPGPGEVEHRTVPGRNYMEVLGAAGAWVASPTDLVTILDSLDPDTPGWKPLDAGTVAEMKTAVNDLLAPDRGYGMGLILYGGGAVGHTGTIESTHAMVFDRADNVTWAITVSGENPSDTVRLAGIVERALVAGGFVAG
jgi:D-alanyl-D-alanine carboxypeptidase